MSADFEDETEEEHDADGEAATIEELLQRDRANIQGWLTRLPAMHTRAVAWLSSPDFEKYYDQAHPPLGLSILAMMFRPLLVRQFIGVLRARGLRSARRWKQYQALGSSGELWFAASVIVNSELRSEPQTPLPALLLVADDQSAFEIAASGLLGSLMGGLYAGEEDQKARPLLTRLLRDDEYTVWRRRRPPVEEAAGFEGTTLDILLTGQFLPPKDFGYIPVLAAPRSGPVVQIPWHIVTGQPSKVPPPMPAASAPPLPIPRAAVNKPAPSLFQRIIWYLFLAGILMGVVQMIFPSLRSDRPARKRPVVASKIDWSQDTSITSGFTPVPSSQYEVLQARNSPASGFLVQIPGNVVMGVTNIENSSAPAPRVLLGSGGAEVTLREEAFRQPESRAQIVESITGPKTCLRFQPQYEIKKGQVLRILYARGEYIDALVSLSEDDSYKSTSGPQLLTLASKSGPIKTGAKGCPVVDPATDTVVGVLKSAQNLGGWGRFDFETLCLPLPKNTSSQ